MRARFAIVGSLVMMFALAMLMSPAAGQTAIPPEVTPEATVEPEPPLPIVLQRPYHCVVSPDSALAAVPNDGVYDLADGSLRFALPVRESNPTPSISFISSARLYVSGLGIFELDTGERLIETISPMVGGNQRWVVTTRGVYDLQSGEMVYDMLRERMSGLIADIWLPPDSNYVLLLIEGRDGWSQVVLSAPTGEIMFQSHYGAVFSPDASRIANIGAGLYATDPKELLARFPSGDYWPIFSQDSQWLALHGPDDVVVYDATTGEYLTEIEVPSQSRPADVVWQDDLLWISRSEDARNPDGTLAQGPIYNSVYEFPSGELLFTHDGQIRHIGGAHEAWLDHDLGVFDPLTGEILLTHPIIFYTSSRDGRVIRVGDGEYDIDTWEKVYDYPDGFTGIVVTDPDTRYALVEQRGLVDAQTGEKLMKLPVHDSYFTPDGQFLVTPINRRRCTVYRLPEAED